MSAPSVSSATPTMPVMLTPAAPSAAATRASEPGLSSSWTVNQTIIERTSSRLDGSDAPAAGRPVGCSSMAPAGSAVRPVRPDLRDAGFTADPRRAPVLQGAAHGRPFVDLHRKPMAAGELRRFVERLGARALADTEGRAWREAGLGYLSMTDADLADRLLADQRLLKMPLVRVENGFAAGGDPAAWKALLSPLTVAMNGWMEGDPAWWVNLQANPEATIELKGQTLKVQAQPRRRGARATRALFPTTSRSSKPETETAIVVLEPRTDATSGGAAAAMLRRRPPSQAARRRPRSGRRP